MSEEDEIAAEAHRIAEERSYSPERFLAMLDRGLYQNFDLSSLPTSQRDLLLPALRSMAQERSGVVRLNAAVALLELGDPVGCQIIVACLKAPEFEVRNGALDRLSWFGLKKHEREHRLHAAGEADAILGGLESCIADPSPRIRRRAVELMFQLSTPQALDFLTRLLGATDWIVRTEAAIYLGLAGLDRGALAILDQLLNQPRDSQPFPGDRKRYMFVRAIENLCGAIDPEVSTRAADVAIRFVRSNLTSGNEIANHICNLLRGISAAQVPCEPELLRKVIASELDWWARGEALKRLAELSGKGGIALLLSAMSDPTLRDAALEGLATLMRKTRDPQVVDALATEIAREKSEEISKIVNAYLVAGGTSIELLDSVAGRVDRDTALTIHWLRNGLTPRTVARCLRPAIVGAGPTEEKLTELEARWRDKPDAKSMVFAIVDRLSVILFKTVDSTPDHAELVTELAEITEYRFAIEDVVQTVESEDELRIRFIHNGAGYTFPVRHHGRYLNGDDVLAGINGVLDRLGFIERFIHIDVGDAAAVVVFVRAEAFFAAAEALRIPLQSNRETVRLRASPT